MNEQRSIVSVKILKTNNGQSLIQALVSLGIMGISIAVFMTMFSSQQKQNKLLGQKLDSLDIKHYLQTTFVNAENCTCLLQGKTFDSTATLPSVPITEVKSSCQPGSNVILKEESTLPGAMSGLAVSKISLREIRPTGNADEFEGLFKVFWDESRLAGPLAPIQFRQRFTTNAASPNTSKEILSCLSFINGYVKVKSTLFTPNGFTPKEGMKLMDATPGTLCTMTGMDDDVGNTVTVGPYNVGYYEYKCRVGLNATGTEWRAWSPLSGGQVACNFICYELTY